MSNGKMTTREYVIEIHTKLDNLEKNFDKLEKNFEKHVDNHGKDLDNHKKNHKFLWIFIVAVPPAMLAIFKIIGGLIKWQ